MSAFGRLGRRARGSLLARLLTAQVLVIVAGSLTLAVVALAIAPTLFEHHLGMAPQPIPSSAMPHIRWALADTMRIALALGGAVALGLALGASWLLARRIVGPIRALARSAGRIARGTYTARVELPGSGDELTDLGEAFNTMAEALETSEQRRRELLADLAHELRTPLATIEGYTEGLSDGVVAADRDTWQVLQAETRRLRRLVDDLNAVSRAEERQLDLNVALRRPSDLVEAAVQAAQAAYQAKGVTLASSVTRRLPQVAVDPDRFAEVFANLLANALRHTPPGGHVQVAASAADDQVRLSVTDTGQGIPPNSLERVFERFYRADPARAHTRSGGSGIGLTITRAIIHAHGGQIRAESSGPGTGTRMVITLPAAGRSRQPAS